MAHTIGTVVPTAIMAGDTPVKKVMIGGDPVWPTVDLNLLTTKLVWVDSRAFYGGTQLTFGQHQAGDLLRLDVQVDAIERPELVLAPLVEGLADAGDFDHDRITESGSVIAAFQIGTSTAAA